MVEEGDLIHGACSVKPSSGYNEVAAGPCSAIGTETSNCLLGEVDSLLHCRGAWVLPPGAEVSSVKHDFMEWRGIVQGAAGCVQGDRRGKAWSR